MMDAKIYKKAKVDSPTDQLYYEFFSSKEKKFEKFYVKKKLDINKLNKALKRGYNPYNYSRKNEIDIIEKISAVKINFYYLFVAFCFKVTNRYLVSIDAYMLVSMFVSTVAFLLFFEILYFYMLIMQKPISINPWYYYGGWVVFIIYNEFLIKKIDKKYMRLKEGYKYYLQKYKLCFIFVALISIVLSILSVYLFFVVRENKLFLLTMSEINPAIIG